MDIGFDLLPILWSQDGISENIWPRKVLCSKAARGLKFRRRDENKLCGFQQHFALNSP